MVNISRLRDIHVSADYLATLCAVIAMVAARFHYEPIAGSAGDFSSYLTFPTVMAEVIFFPPLMIFIYWLSGYYTEPLLRSRLSEFTSTLSSTGLGTLIFFFVAIINDLEPDHLYIYKLLLIQWSTLFSIIYFERLIITGIIQARVHSGELYRNVLIVGSGREATEMRRRLDRAARAMGIRVIGYATLYPDRIDDDTLPVMSLDEAIKAISQGAVSAAVVTADPRGTADTLAVINRLLPTGCRVLVDPDFYKRIGAPARTQQVEGEPLVNISEPVISNSTACVKRTLDVVISAMGLLLLWPMLAVIAIMVKCDSPGPVLYRQERIGRNKKPFTIYKFRSMYRDAEAAGPQLSSATDPRITRLGHYLRKYRLDELPQLWNVLRGDMSLVGPRPEREFFINQILERDPSYALVQQVRPGLTSWGMVKFGYASTVDDMLKRLRYELIYLDNISTVLDLRIILLTIKIVITGRGV